MHDGSHFTTPSGRPPRRLRRIAGVACGAVAVGATALLIVEVIGGSSHRPTLSLASSVAHPAGAAGTGAAASTTTAAPTTTTTSQPSTAPGGGSFLLPDGSPLPVLVVFDGFTITLAGALPSEVDASRLRALAQANSKIPARIIDRLVVDARVPSSVGVRVIEMNAERFAEGSSQVTPDYSPELTRVVDLMRALPWVTTVVIGHADQSGTSTSNLQLSQDRATAVIDYLISQGISPDRLSGQGVGDRDPLTSHSGTTGLALNRRTEFVFHGLLVSAAR